MAVKAKLFFWYGSGRRRYWGGATAEPQRRHLPVRTLMDFGACEAPNTCDIYDFPLQQGFHERCHHGARPPEGFSLGQWQLRSKRFRQIIDRRHLLLQPRARFLADLYKPQRAVPIDKICTFPEAARWPAQAIARGVMLRRCGLGGGARAPCLMQPVGSAAGPGPSPPSRKRAARLSPARAQSTSAW